MTMSENESEAGKGRLFKLLFDQEATSGCYFEIALQVIILANVLLMLFPPPGTFENTNAVFEWLCVAGVSCEGCFLLFFAIEFVARCGTAWRRKRDYFQSGWFFIDFIAVVPSVILFFIPSISMSFQAFRILRVIRVFKMKKLREAGSVMFEVTRRSWDELSATLAIIFSMLVGASILMTILETNHSEDSFSHGWESMWWALGSIVGNSEVEPESLCGRVIGGLVYLVAVLAFALPTAVLGSSFVEVMGERKTTPDNEGPLRCPHCGESITGDHGAEG